MNTCSKCGSQARQNRDGVIGVGSQRYKCMQCGSKYTPMQKARGYDQETRKKAIQLYVDGMNLRQNGRHLGLHHRTVSLWVQAYAQGIIHYLARLARRSRCFSHCPLALSYAVRLFFFAFNTRQLYKQQFPQYAVHVFEFATHEFSHSRHCAIRGLLIVDFQDQPYPIHDV